MLCAMNKPELDIYLFRKPEGHRGLAPLIFRILEPLTQVSLDLLTETFGLDGVVWDVGELASDDFAEATDFNCIEMSFCQSSE